MRPRTSLFATIPLVLVAAVTGASAAYADAQDRAQDRVDDSARLVREMKQDPSLGQLLNEARGVFIIPHYGKAAFIVGGQGGGGVVLAKHDDRWTDPAFFNIGGGSIGAQAGATGGSIVMMLMTRRAVDQFERTTGKWSLHAGGDLTVVRYSGNMEASTRGRNDIIVWTDTRGPYGGLTAGVTDITPDNRLDRDYYHEGVTPQMILTGKVTAHEANDLRGALSERVAER
jgi:lipid-binding SYLF domain-containing protein